MIAYYLYSKSWRAGVSRHIGTGGPHLEAWLQSLREGDTLIVWRLDRLGRSLGDLIRLTQDLKPRGVSFASLTEQIDTRSPTGQLVFHASGALAEFERHLIRERTLTALKSSRARGHKCGQPRKLSMTDLKMVSAMLKSGDISVSMIAENSRCRALLCTETPISRLCSKATAQGGK